MAYTKVSTGASYSPIQIQEKAWKEYIRASFWGRFMGKNLNSAIVVNEDLMNTKGDSTRVPYTTELEGGVVTGETQGIGNEGSFDILWEGVTVEEVRVLAKLKNVKGSQQRTKINLRQTAKDVIVRKSKSRLDSDTTTAMSDTSEGRVQGRYLYGDVETNWDATHATALANVTSGMLLDLPQISRLKRKARIPNNAVAKIAPMMVKIGSGLNAGIEEWFVYIFHDYASRDLEESDARFKNKQLFLPPNPERNSILFTGSSFKGAHGGVLLHSYDGLKLDSSTIQTSHNLFLGAQAGIAAWAIKPQWGEEDTDVGHIRTYDLFEMRKIQKAVFNRSTPEDNGVIHHFTPAVTDA